MTETGPIDASHNFEDEHEFFEERAGILEFDAGYPRGEAERLARIETLARYYGGSAMAIIRRAASEAVEVRLARGRLRVSGETEHRREWAPTLQRFETELISILKAAEVTRRK